MVSPHSLPFLHPVHALILGTMALDGGRGRGTRVHAGAPVPSRLVVSQFFSFILLSSAQLLQECLLCTSTVPRAFQVVTHWVLQTTSEGACIATAILPLRKLTDRESKSTAPDHTAGERQSLYPSSGSLAPEIMFLMTAPRPSHASATHVTLSVEPHGDLEGESKERGKMREGVSGWEQSPHWLPSSVWHQLYAYREANGNMIVSPWSLLPSRKPALTVTLEKTLPRLASLTDTKQHRMNFR